MQIQRSKILILGGTNFMGKALLDNLCREQPSSQIICLNRGKVYWNDQSRKDNPSVIHHYLDRKEHKETKNTLTFLATTYKVTKQNKWKCVIDFTSYKWRDVQSVVQGIKDKAELYIFISTDSVYNNSYNTLPNPIQEYDLNSELTYHTLKQNKQNIDKYGYNKLKCELYLQRTSYVPYVCLRLPDVIGPFDNTERLWSTIKWVANSHTYPIPLSAKDQTVKLSFVSSLDLAKIITQIIRNGPPPSKVYNLSFDKNVTIAQFINTIATLMKVDVKYKAQKDRNPQNSKHFYPSVGCGCISSKKAIQEINWNPSSLKQCLQKSVQFFVKRGHEFPIEKHDMERQFKRKVIQND